MSSAFSTFAGIMFFYAVLSYFVGPLLFYFFWSKTLQSAGYGFIAGSILSIFLWVMYGSQMV